MGVLRTCKSRFLLRADPPMDISTSLFLLLCLVLSCFLVFVAGKLRRTPLPPGPPRFPIIGNILQVGSYPHRSFADLSRIYGPIMSLKLGSITTVVVSSPEVAREVLQTHDQVLSGRTVSDPLRAIGQHHISVVWLPAISHRWRYLRKILASLMLVKQRLDATMSLRTKKVKELLNFLKENCERGEAVDIGRAVFITALNVISNTMFSVDFGSYDGDSTASQEFQEVVAGIMEAGAKPNIANYFPILGFLDLQGVRKQMRTCADKLFQISQEIIDARLSQHEPKDASRADLLDSLLDLTQQQDSELTVKDVKHLLLDLTVAGTDTSSSTVEWAMSELLRKPDTMVKAQTEIEQIIGKNGVVRESDISNLPYLQAVVKETLRLHPPAPFLLPRRAEADTRIFGFHVPKNAQILVNVWDIGRDPSIWDNPKEFEPERFLGRAIDVKGKDFQLTPFGAGRRICPGMSMGLRMVHSVMASLLSSFDWNLPNGVVPEDVDMDEAFGIALHKAKPLYAVPCSKKH